MPKFRDSTPFDGRLNSIIARRFESNGASFFACAASSSPERFSDEVAENFGWTVTLGEFTLKVLREKELADKKDKDTQNLISAMKKEVEEAQKATDQLEGANAQLANALLDVSSAKAQSKAILATVGIGIILFAISEPQQQSFFLCLAHLLFQNLPSRNQCRLRSLKRQHSRKQQAVN